MDRWGVPGLAVVGGLVLGPTLTLAAVLLLGVDRGRYAVWSTAATMLLFAALTVFWDAVLS